MTDEERREAERALDRLHPSGWRCLIPRENSQLPSSHEEGYCSCDMIQMYAAAVEAKNELLQFARDHYSSVLGDYSRKLEFERDRSARLIGDLRMIANQIDLSEWQSSHGSASLAFYAASNLINQAIAKYRGQP